MTYKIKLQPGDYCRRDMGEDKYREVAQRFFDDGCPKCEVGDYGGCKYFGWAFANTCRGFFHSQRDHLDRDSAFYGGRELTYEQVMEKEVSEPVYWDGKGLPPIGSICEFYTTDYFQEGICVDEWENGDLLECLAHRFGYQELLPIFYNQRHKTASGLISGYYRPTKSEKDKVIQDVADIIYEYLDSVSTIGAKDCAKKLYDLGMLKVPTNKE